MKRFVVVAAVLLGGCTFAEASTTVSYQQDIREPDAPLYRWDDTSLGVVCYGRAHNSSTFFCVQVTAP